MSGNGASRGGAHAALSAASRIEVRLVDATRCTATHHGSGRALETDAPRELGGGGTTFSSTDLVAAALGTCIGSSLAPILLRAKLPLAHVAIVVEKRLSTLSKRIARLAVAVRLGFPASAVLRRKLERAARGCAVHRSLAAELEVEIRLLAARRG